MNRFHCSNLRSKLLRYMLISLSMIGGVAGNAAAAPSGLDENGHLVAVTRGDQAGFSYVELESGVQLRVGDKVKNVIFYGPTTVRVNENLGQNYWEHPSIVVIGQPASVPYKVSESGDDLSITSDHLQIVVDTTSGALTFLDADGKLLTKERADQPSEIKQVEISGAPTYEAANTFTLKPDEGWYGLGYIDSASSRINRRGQEVRMIQTNLGIVIPMILSSERYGIMWDTYSVMRFKDDQDGARLWAESALLFLCGQGSGRSHCELSCVDGGCSNVSEAGDGALYEQGALSDAGAYC